MNIIYYIINLWKLIILLLFACDRLWCYNQTDFEQKAGVIIRKIIKKADIILLACILLAALISAVIFWVQPFEGQLYACIYIDGEYIESIPLQEELNQVDIATPYGENVLIIINNKAYIKESDCGYEQCVKKGAISRPMQSIVCAPHGLVITVEDETKIKGK